ncbi:LHFPL tetraspan subfamily member 3 protein-like isoform X1 [Ruditapes philippinarum]|uniref:LHFPL tetraspan subfamily member 3 protein-like isoform X1 n=1 Tax=Ruditapes philippinarum TaxID=129788 RepID=UPI00295B9A84|nr:LHFPL tetraspan subfamily member 3 protein-like isoform X1 [Ruditapes philippinarum]
MDQREMEWNAEVTKIQHTNYVRNSRAITVAWFVFSACYTILNIVAFIQPFWFGDTKESPGVGYFGLYEICERVQGSDYKCTGDFLDFNTIQNEYFQASSFLVGGASLLFIFSIICMLLFLFLKPRIVLKLCGILQLIAALFMAVGCIIYPNAFDDDNVRRICGQDATAYNMDKCRIRWAYILAIVLIFDALILAVLAFVLAARQAIMFPEFKKLKEEIPQTNNFTGKLEQPSVRQQEVRRRHAYTTAENRNLEDSAKFGSLNGQTVAGSVTPGNKSISNTSSRSNDEFISTTSSASPVLQNHSNSQKPEENDVLETGSLTRHQTSTHSDMDLSLDNSEDIHL